MIYPYACSDCGSEWEEEQRLSDPVLTTCPTCGGHAKRMIGLTSFVLRGYGWARDGYIHTDLQPGEKLDR